MKNRKGFTLVEVLVAVAIIVLIGTMMVNAYISTFRASKSLYDREQMKLTLLEWTDYCSNSPLLPKKIVGDNISEELHLDNVNLFNNGTDSRFKTFFGPIDNNSVKVKSFDGVNWVATTVTATDSGTVEIKGIHNKIIVSYNVLGWNYIKDRRFNYGNTIILSYGSFDLRFAATDDGIDIPIKDITIFNVKDGRIIITTNKDKWITLYYRIPKNTIFNVIKPDGGSYSYSNNIITFNSDIQNHYVLVSYNKRTELVKCNSLKQAILSENIDYIYNIECITIETQALWEGRKISYISAVKNYDLY